MLSHHDPSTVYLGGDRLFKSTTRGDTWTASPDLTKNIGRNDRPIMGVAGTAPMASKHDGAASYSNIVTIGESPLVAGHRLGGHQRRQRPGEPRRRRDVEERGRQHQGRARRRRTSRASSRRHFDAGTCYVSFDGHRSDDHKPYVFVTRDFGQTWTSIAANLPDRQRQRHQGGSEEPQPPLPRHRVRLLHLVDRRQGLEAIHDRPSDGPHRRRPGAPARQRPRRRHPRPQHLDHRRHHAAAADDRRDHDDRRAPLRGAQGHGVGERHYEGERTQRRQALPRPESAGRHGHQLLPEGRGDRRRQDHDQRRDRTRRPRDGWHEGRRAESRAVESRSNAGPRRPFRRRRSVAADEAAVAVAAAFHSRWDRTPSNPAPTWSSWRLAARS